MAFYDEEEVRKLQEETAVTGNDTVDGYWLGYHAGRREVIAKEHAESERNWKWYMDEKKRANALEAENAKLKAEVGKLKKKLGKGM